MKKLLTLTLSLLMAFSMCLTVSAADSSFEVNGEQKGTLLDALNAVTTSDVTEIDLIAEEYDETSACIEIPSDRNIVLDLNGNSLAIYAIECFGTLTIKDSLSEDGDTGSVVLKNYDGQNDHFEVYKGLILDNVSIGIEDGHSNTSHNIIAAYENSVVTMNGGGVEAGDSFINVKGSNAHVTIEGSGFFIISGNMFNVADGINNSSITVKGGNFYNFNPIRYLPTGYTVKTISYRDYTIYEIVEDNTNANTNTNTTSTKSYDAKDKNQDGIITCDEEMDNPNWVWSDTKGACVYSVTNTSAR